MDLAAELAWSTCNRFTLSLTLALLMDPPSLYRGNRSITSAIQSAGRLPTGNFYSPRDRNGGGASTSAAESHSGEAGAMSAKIDQMMMMMSTTQQILLAQQDTCKRLETTVTSLNNEVAIIKEELSGQSKKVPAPSSKCKVPSELSVSNLVMFKHRSL